MTTYRTCSWCHDLNPADRQRCLCCGHDAHRSRLGCTCERCKPQEQPAAGPCPACGGITSLGMCGNEACEQFIPW